MAKLDGSDSRDRRHLERLPAAELRKVTAKQIHAAAQKLADGFTDHRFGESTDYDLITPSGVRLDPKAVFGVAATDALGFSVRPIHFSGGTGTLCFRALQAAGYHIVRKGTRPEPEDIAGAADREWAEGSPQLRAHLRRERARGLAAEKIADFRRMHGGRLFCERCSLDPGAAFGELDGPACIEVHHHATRVSNMKAGHRTRLRDLQCLCANCHRIVHSELRRAE
jgi:5-methylcytosine-specific restriction protein A